MEERKKLRKEIIALQYTLNEKKKLLYNLRLSEIIKINILETQQVSAITFNMNSFDTWAFSYIFTTNLYDDAIYDDIYDDNPYDIEDSDDNPDSIVKIEKIEKRNEKKIIVRFGVNKGKYFIDTTSDTNDDTTTNRFRMYKNSKGLVRILNIQKQNELNLNEQIKLISAYAADAIIPEYVALRFFLFMNANKWTDKDIYVYFTAI